MANIDTSTIEGFDGMTADEKVTALLGLQIPDPVDLSGYVKRMSLMQRRRRRHRSQNS